VASQLNRTTQSQRQPGSSIKPLTYLTALHKGLQPDTMVLDAPVTLPPIGGTGNAKSYQYWTPKNYEGGSRGVMTLRRALEQSRNLVTVRLLRGAIDESPKDSLYEICDLAEEAHLYPECMRLYPFVLGAQAIRMIDLAAFYAAIATEGSFNQPYAIEAIEQKDRTVYRHAAPSPKWLAGGDRVAFYQLRTMLEGVVARGTAASLKHLAGYIGGKTGTTDNENDAWFVSFTNDVTVAVWVGYDNTEGRRTLGSGGTGGKVAAPIAEPIIQASWIHQAPKVLLPPPSAEIQRKLKAVAMGGRGGDGYTEYLRIDDTGKVVETKFARAGGGGGRYHGAGDEDDDGPVGMVPRSDPYGFHRTPYGYYRNPNPNSVLRKEEDRF
jgi:membrane carboxypeptidase/penicillin-binding protein